MKYTKNNNDIVLLSAKSPDGIYSTGRCCDKDILKIQNTYIFLEENNGPEIVHKETLNSIQMDRYHRIGGCILTLCKEC